MTQDIVQTSTVSTRSQRHARRMLSPKVVNIWLHSSTVRIPHEVGLAKNVNTFLKLFCPKVWYKTGGKSTAGKVNDVLL